MFFFSSSFVSLFLFCFFFSPRIRQKGVPSWKGAWPVDRIKQRGCSAAVSLLLRLLKIRSTCPRSVEVSCTWLPEDAGFWANICWRCCWRRRTRWRRCGSLTNASPRILPTSALVRLRYYSAVSVCWVSSCFMWCHETASPFTNRLYLAFCFGKIKLNIYCK